MNIGIVVNNLGNSEQNYDVLQLIEKINSDSNKMSPCLFFQNVIPSIISPPCLNMNITGISNFKGKMLAVGLDSAQVVYNNHANTENWLLLWDIPWITSILNYDSVYDIMSKFKIIVRSQSHYDIVKNYTNRNDITIAANVDEIYKCLT